MADINEKQKGEKERARLKSLSKDELKSFLKSVDVYRPSSGFAKLGKSLNMTRTNANAMPELHRRVDYWIDYERPRREAVYDSEQREQQIRNAWQGHQQGWGRSKSRRHRAKKSKTRKTRT